MKISNPKPIQFTAINVATSIRAIDGTVYFNSSVPRMVIVTMTMNTNGDNIAQFYIGATAAPATLAAEWGGNVLLAAQSYGSVTFIVPVGYYYKATQTGTITLLAWLEHT